jgi:hypothetical protein
MSGDAAPAFGGRLSGTARLRVCLEQPHYMNVDEDNQRFGVCEQGLRLPPCSHEPELEQVGEALGSLPRQQASLSTESR